MAKKKKICLTDEEIERAGAAWARGDAAPAIKIKLNWKQAGEVLGSASDVLNVVHNVLKESEQFNSDLNVLAETYGKVQSIIQAWKEEAKLLFNAAENVGIADVDKLAEHIRNNPPSAGAIALLILVVQDKYKQKSAIAAADARHSQPGGSRDLKRQIQEKWAEGNCSSRDICAEQEYSGLGFGSLKAARNALIKTPNPNPWPAKR